METCGALLDCPGKYCGQINISNLTTLCYSACQACPSGYRIHNSSLCQPCDSTATSRDYLYLIFMSLVTLCIRYSITTLTNWYKLNTIYIIPLYVIPLIEVFLAIIFTLLSLPPQGSIYINSCSVNSISDFYPIFFNPRPDYVHQLHCTYEVVYPLYSMVFIFFGFYFALHLPLLIGLFVLAYFTWSREWREYWPLITEYVWLITYPILLIVHGGLAGVIYYIFDYVTIVVSIGAFGVLSTVLQAYKHEDFKNPFKVYTLSVQWLLVVGTMILLACGILSLTEWADVATRAHFIPLVILPPILQPILNLFASPQLLFLSWNVETMNDEYYEY